MSERPMKIGLLGAGYIASWHAEALKRVKGASLYAVCDLSENAARSLAATYGAKKVFTSLEAMLEDGAVDSVHVLTPPQAHVAPTRAILEAGKHAFVEKPLALTAEEARSLAALASEKGVSLGVNHNFLMLPSYERLKRAVETGAVGAMDSLSAHWRFTLPPMRSGPFGLWMLREPTNILFELGPHLFAFAADLLGDVDVEDVKLRYPIETPGGGVCYQGWRISAAARETAAQFDLSLIEGHDDRSLEVRGLGALARVDYAQDTYTVQKAPMGDIVVAPFMAEAGIGAQRLSNAVVNAARQLTSLNTLAPYGLSITRACQAFYKGVAAGAPVDRRLSADLAVSAVGAIEAAAAIATKQITPRATIVAPAEPPQATKLVIGGTGFIGRRLVEQLADQGVAVRVFSRGKGAGFERADGRVSVFTGDLKSDDDLADAMKGVDGVYHLARADEKTWEGYLENDVAVTRRIGEACLKAGVKRLVYTGTIDSYDAGQPDRPITEETPFDENLEERNLYARSKAACEAALLELAGEKGLPLVIVRPGIVIGKRGPLQHWGVAMWRGATACTLWGDGRNTLPFVSVDDTADGLIRAMTTEGVEGRSFNLIGEPMLTARDYFEEIEKANGVKMRAKPTPIWTYFAVDVAKYWAKKLLARKKNLTKPTMRDWRSRAQLSPFRNDAAKRALGWAPEADREAFVKATIVDANLFGIARRGVDDKSEKSKAAA
ncbi:MAG: NAD-dependent epimerase/dehydratase family protein [Pseudomonadota bacterium]